MLNLFIKERVPHLIGVFVSIIALSVMIGWWMGNALLIGTIPGFAGMQFITAFLFVCSGGVVWGVATLSTRRDSRIEIVVLVLSFIIAMIALSTFIEGVFRLGTAIEDLIFENPSFVASGPRLPSLPTTFLFVAIASIGALVAVRNSKWRLICSYIGRALVLISGVALFGHIVRIPFLYYAFPGITSSSMAANTSALFIGAGFGFILIGRGMRPVETSASQL